jgi:hypothetical protein
MPATICIRQSVGYSKMDQLDGGKKRLTGAAPLVPYAHSSWPLRKILKPSA